MSKGRVSLQLFTRNEWNMTVFLHRTKTDRNLSLEKVAISKVSHFY